MLVANQCRRINGVDYQPGQPIVEPEKIQNPELLIDNHILRREPEDYVPPEVQEPAAPRRRLRPKEIKPPMTDREELRVSAKELERRAELEKKGAARRAENDETRDARIAEEKLDDAEKEALLKEPLVPPPDEKPSTLPAPPKKKASAVKKAASKKKASAAKKAKRPAKKKAAGKKRAAKSRSRKG